MHDNARPYVAKSTHQESLDPKWTTVHHPPHSPNLTPLSYHMYRSLSNHLREKRFNNENDLKIDHVNFFDEKSHDFYGCGILSLSERWRQRMGSNGAYIVER